MYQTTEAIVLYQQKHGDHAMLLHTYTRASGRMNYMVFGVGAKRKGITQVLPLSLVEISADIRPDRTIPTASEIRVLCTPSLVDVDIRRHSVALFIAEVLYRTLKYPMEDESLFKTLVTTLEEVRSAEDIENVHVRFMVQYAAQLGFAIDEKAYPHLLVTPSNRSQRHHLLQLLCDYYASNIEDWSTPKSLEVLTELFD